MQKNYAIYEEALAEELIPAMGCTEPIAIAYCAAVCREQLGAEPEQIEIWVSRNIIKNVKSVVVPNTDRVSRLRAQQALWQHILSVSWRCWLILRLRKRLR